VKGLGSAFVTLAILAAAGACAWLGVYQVAPDEEAIVLRLGSYHRTVGPGLRWRVPGLERYETRAVTVTIEEEFGYRTVESGPPPVYEDRPGEKRMLSGDANIVNVEFVLQYRIDGLREFLLRVAGAPGIVREAAQAAIREVVAEQPIDDVLTARGPIETEAEQRIQEVLDAYEAGVRVISVRLQDVEPPDEVKEAFADVESAKQDRERQIFEAQGYADQVVPRARGRAEELLNESRGYKERRVQEARGEADRFTALLAEYERAPEVTRERLYLETLEEILPRMEKVLVDEGKVEGVLPYLPLGRRGERP
jgi:membrane protease subunit HflK